MTIFNAHKSLLSGALNKARICDIIIKKFNVKIGYGYSQCDFYIINYFVCLNYLMIYFVIMR